MTTYSINVGSTEATSSPVVVSSRVVWGADHSHFHFSALLPPTIPRSQLYYWSELWQAGEAETLEELRAGHGFRFDNPVDAVRWLLADD